MNIITLNSVLLKYTIYYNAMMYNIYTCHWVKHKTYTHPMDIAYCTLYICTVTST